MLGLQQGVSSPTSDHPGRSRDLGGRFWGMEGLSQLMARGNPLRCNGCGSVQIGTKARKAEDATNYDALRECLVEINRLVASMGNIRVAK